MFYCFSMFFIINFQPVSYIKCMIIVCLTIFISILSPFQDVSYIMCVIIVGLISFPSLSSPFQEVSYIKCMPLTLLFTLHFDLSGG